MSTRPAYQFAALTRRPIDAQDLPFLLRIYASTRAEEMDLLSHWTTEEKAAFLQQQFHAQHTHYQTHFGRAQFELLLWNGEPAGRLYVDRRTDEIRLIDIALLPAHRGRGLGTALLQELLTEAAARQLPVRIHVEHYNPALRLYQRLGFRPIADRGVYLFMEWTPPPAT